MRILESLNIFALENFNLWNDSHSSVSSLSSKTVSFVFTVVSICFACGMAQAQHRDAKLVIRGQRLGYDVKLAASPQIHAPGSGQSHNSWDDRFGYGKSGALNGWASAVAANEDGHIYVGGQFTKAGDLASANHLAVWDGEQWSVLGSGVDGPVSVIHPHGDDVYVGGDFTSTGGVAAAGIARWDGDQWNAVGPGLPGTVTDIEFYNGDLYVSGWFERAPGNDLASFVARWDGTSWRSLAAGVDDWVTSMTVYDGRLIVAGLFSSANGFSGTKGIAAWDGTRWSRVGQGMDDLVMSVASDGENLYAGGAFSSASGVAGTKHIARWDGRVWHPLGEGLDDWASSIDVRDGAVLVGGWFKAAGSTAASRVALWDESDSAWQSVGNGVSYTVDKETAVLSVGQMDGDMYVAGVFNLAGNRSSIGFGRWIGEEIASVDVPKIVAPQNADNVESTSVELIWEAVTGAVSYTVQVAQDQEFNNPTTLSSTATAKMFNQVQSGKEYFWRVRAEFAYTSGFWSETMSFTRVMNTSLEGDLLPGEFRLDQNYPNPFNPGTTIRYELGSTADVVLTVYSIDGRKVATLVNGTQSAGVHQVAFDASSLSSGVYVYRLQTPQNVISRTMTLVK